MFKVTKQMRTETAHRLAGHPGRCQYIHGHSYLWEITLESNSLQDGMVVDFSQLKAAMTDVIDVFDHALVLDRHDPMTKELFEVLTKAGLGRIFLTDYRPTAENMATETAAALKHTYFPQFNVTVKLWETATSYAEASA